MTDHSIVAGAIYEFAAYLTALPGIMPVSASSDTAPMVEHIKDWAEIHDLDIKGARVMSWREQLEDN